MRLVLPPIALGTDAALAPQIHRRAAQSSAFMGFLTDRPDEDNRFRSVCHDPSMADSAKEKGRAPGRLGAGNRAAETKRLVEQVKRNLERFPEDFMFQLHKDEAAALRSQIATSNAGRGGRRSAP
jgi:hypothetical protein